MRRPEQPLRLQQYINNWKTDPGMTTGRLRTGRLEDRTDYYIYVFSITCLNEMNSFVRVASNAAPPPSGSFPLGFAWCLCLNPNYDNAFEFEYFRSTYHRRWLQELCWVRALWEVEPENIQAVGRKQLNTRPRVFPPVVWNQLFWDQIIKWSWLKALCWRHTVALYAHSESSAGVEAYSILAVL